jgi:hypothetical protein
MEDVVMIYRTVSMPNGGEAVDVFVDSTFRNPFADWMGFFSLLWQSEEKKIKYYAIDSVDVLHKLGSAAGGDPWWVKI